MLEAFAALDHHFGGGHARTTLIVYLAHDIAPQLRACTDAPDSVRSGLFSVAAELTYLAGFRYFDTLDHGLAQRYYLAARAGDPLRFAIILRGLSQQALYLGQQRPALTMATAALTTLTLARTTRPVAPDTTALLHLQVAVCHAALGHRDAALGHHQRAKHQPLHATDPVSLTGSCRAGELAYQTAHIRRHLRESGSAITALHAALRHYPNTYRRSRALTLITLAQLHLDTGQLASARALLPRLHTDCAPLRSARVSTALAALARQLPIPSSIGSSPPPNGSALLGRKGAPQNCRHQEGPASVAVTTEQSATPDPRPAGRQRAGAGLSGTLAVMLADYRTALAEADLSDNARRGYRSRVAGFLDWLSTGPNLTADGDPLMQPIARDDAVRDYQSWLKTVRRATPWTINAHLTALDHFYAHHLGLGAPVVERERITQAAPEALEPDEQRRFIRACGRCGATRNAAIGVLMLYTGLRVEEVEALDLDDIQLSARRGKVIVRNGNNEVYREVPLHRAARTALRAWLDARPRHRGADDTGTVFLSRRGQRMRVRAIRYVIAELGLAARLVHEPGHPNVGKSKVHPHTLRHTFGTQLLRNGVDIVTVADLMGHTIVDTTRTYTRSSEADHAHVIEAALITDE